MHKAGFVNIIGYPNVGKSTLMNAMLKERLSIISPKAQTTRHRIIGIVSEEDYQVIFSDTPGVLEPSYAMQETMQKAVMSVFADSDVLVIMLEPRDRKFGDEEVMKRIRNSKAAKIIALNKTDLFEDKDILEGLAFWQSQFPDAEMIPISALNDRNTEKLFELIVKHLPEHPAYYPKDMLTDRSERFFVSEIIREKILKNYKQEVPYSCEVVVVSFKEEDKLIRISAEIHVNRKTQKSIIIGKGGAMLKKVGTEARKDIEAFLNKKVFLELYVKVSENWRDDEKKLKGFGY